VRKVQAATSVLGLLWKQMAHGMEKIPEMPLSFQEKKKPVGGCGQLVYCTCTELCYSRLCR